VCAPALMGIGRITNISLTGAYLETAMQLRLLSVLDVTAVDARLLNGRARGMSACVVRRDSSGVGLEWCESVAERTSVDARLLLLLGRDKSSPLGPVQAYAPPSMALIPLSVNHR